MEFSWGATLLLRSELKDALCSHFSQFKSDFASRFGPLFCQLRPLMVRPPIPVGLVQVNLPGSAFSGQQLSQASDMQPGKWCFAFESASTLISQFKSLPQDL